jgi:hypothetical protein
LIFVSGSFTEIYLAGMLPPKATSNKLSGIIYPSLVDKQLKEK